MFQLYYLMRKLEKSRGYKPAKERRRAGMLRLFAFGCVVSTAVGTCSMQSSASAQVREASLGIGAQMMEFSDLLADPHLVTMNGEQLFISSGTSKDDIKVTLDRFEAHCRSKEGVTGELWRKITATPNLKEHFPEGSPLNLMRREDEHEGMVICLVKIDGRPAKPLAAAISDFVNTRDLGALGALRYVYVRKSNGGNSVITAWTEDKFNFGKMFPSDGAEPPGTDSLTLPRPAGDSHRILSAKIEGTPFGVRVYQTGMKPEEVYASYDTVMKNGGWLPITKSDRRGDAPYDGRGYLKDGVYSVIAANADPNGGSVVSLGDLGGGTTDKPPHAAAALH